jgi:hypothetical protein
MIYTKQGVQSAGWWDIHFTAGTCCERAAPLADRNAAARHHVLRTLISLHNEHRVFYGKCNQFRDVSHFVLRTL